MHNARNPSKERGIEMTRLRTLVIPTLVFLTLSRAATLHAQVRQRPGMWESTVTSHGKTDTLSSCVEPSVAALLDGPEALIRAKLDKLASTVCTIENFKLDGNTVIYAMVCGKTTTLIETKFHGSDSQEATMTVTRDGVTNLKQVKSRRTGDCEAGK
jgi:hypothetical protein